MLNHGLEPALQSLAGQATVPTEVVYEAGDELPEPVELAAYFVTSEALANVGKYARGGQRHGPASRASGTARSSRSSTTASAAPTPRAARACAALTDRVEALDGQLRVLSPPGHGTIVRAELPCGS